MNSDYNTIPPIVPSKASYRKAPQKNRQHYGKTHQALRKELLAKRPVCEYQYEGCTGFATEADHLRYPARSIEDYKAACQHCHKLRHKN